MLIMKNPHNSPTVIVYSRSIAGRIPLNIVFQTWQLPVPYNPDYTPNRFYEVPGAPLRYSTSPFFRDPPDLASYLVQVYAERRYMISFQQPPHGGFFIYYPVTSHNSKGAFTMKITTGIIPGAIKVLIYGPEGIGKSTLASQFPDPLFIDTEGSTRFMDVKRLPDPEIWDDIMAETDYVIENPNCCRTLVIDTADWAESLCMEKMLKESSLKSIEDYGYGKGYVMLGENFKTLLVKLDAVISKGINVVIIAHAQMRKFEQPGELGAYDRWELKLQKKTSPVLKEWADMVLFCNYRTYVVNVDGQGAAKGKNIAQGGERVIYTTHHNCWDAKNRFGLPDVLPLSYQSISNVISQASCGPAKEATATCPGCSCPDKPRTYHPIT